MRLYTRLTLDYLSPARTLTRLPFLFASPNPIRIHLPLTLYLSLSIFLPFVTTPNDVKVFDCGFFFTERIGSLNVVFSYGWVTFASLNLRPIGLMNLSCFGGFLVKFYPTKQILFILLFQHFLFLFPDLITSNISASVIGLTFSTGTDHLPAFSFLFCLTMLVRTLEFFCCYLSIKYVGMAPSSMSSTLLLAFFYSWALIVFFI